MMSALDSLNSIRRAFQNGIKAYSELVDKLLILEKEVKDHIFARDIEKQALIEEIKFNKNYENFNTSHLKLVQDKED